MHKNVNFFCIVLIALSLLPSVCLAQSDSVIATIWLPDQFSGVVHPRAFTYNPITNKIYVCGGRRVLVIDGETDQKIAGITVGDDAWALACDTFHNKVYCANRGSDNVTVIDGQSDSIITAVQVGDEPVLLAYNCISLIRSLFSCLVIAILSLLIMSVHHILLG